MLIIWDYFGVVAQDAFWYTAERLAEMRGMRPEIKDAQHKADLGLMSWEDYTEMVSKDIDVPVDEVRRKYKEHDINLEVLRAIRHYSEDKHVLLSNASAEYLVPIMRDLGLDTYFDDVYVSSEIGYAKPDRRAFLHVLHATSYSPSDVIMIDDSEQNIASAREIGIKGIRYHKNLNIISLLKDQRV